jgi:alpha-tubulin suppressor-like RCC1 family protein
MKRIAVLGVCLMVSLVLAGLMVGSASATSYGVMAWGAGGTLGNGASPSSDAPVGGSGLTNVTAVAPGYVSSLAVSGGTVYAWGQNGTGELATKESTGPENCGGTGPEIPCSRKPVAVSGLSGVTAISTNGLHAMVLLSSGKVMTWGGNERGQLGIGSTTGPETCSSGLACSTSPVEVSGLSGVIAISAGYDFDLALLSSGKIMAWGNNEYGQLGDGSTETRSAPVEVLGVSELGEGVHVVSVSGGYQESMALLSNGKVMAWGVNQYGQLGQGKAEGPETCFGDPCSRKPLEVHGLGNVTQMQDGYWNAVALREDGTVATWGKNTGGELGIGKTTGPELCSSRPCSSTPVEVPGLSGVVSVSANVDVFAVLSNGTAVSWGTNSGLFGSGKLGVGTLTGPEKCPETIPVKERSSCAMKPTPVVGVLEVGAIAAGQAGAAALVPPPSGAPEFGRCIKVESAGVAQYENGGCTKPGGSKSFEWYPGVLKQSFTTAGGETLLETVTFGVTLRCKSETGTGEYEGRTALRNVIMRFHECETGLGTGKCTSPGASEGEVVTATLSGVLGVEKTSSEGPIKNKIGLQLTPSEGTFAEFNCPAAFHTVRGAVIGPAVSNVMSVTPKRNFSSAGAKQKPERFESGPLTILEEANDGEPFERAALNLTSVQTNAEAIEINSVA